MTIISDFLLATCVCPLIVVVAFLEQPSTVTRNLTYAHLNLTHPAVNLTSVNRNNQPNHQSAPHGSLSADHIQQQNQPSAHINGGPNVFQTRRNLTSASIHSSGNPSASGTVVPVSTIKPVQYGNQYLIHNNSYINAPSTRRNLTYAHINMPANQNTSGSTPFGLTQRQYGNQHALSVLLSHGSHGGSNGNQPGSQHDGNGLNALCQKVCRGNSPCPPECSNLQPWSIVKRSNTRKNDGNNTIIET